MLVTFSGGFQFEFLPGHFLSHNTTVCSCLRVCTYFLH